MNEIRKSDPEMTQLARTLMPLAEMLGFEVMEAAPGRVEARAGWAPERCTTGGVLHGGYLMAVADSAGAVCAGFNLPQGATMATIESKTNFFRGVTEGHIEVVAIPVHVGRTTIMVQTDITNASGKLVSRTTQTQYIIAPK